MRTPEQWGQHHVGGELAGSGFDHGPGLEQLAPRASPTATAGRCPNYGVEVWDAIPLTCVKRVVADLTQKLTVGETGD